MIVVLKLFTNVVEGNSFGVRVKSRTESSKSRLVEALTTFISIDNAGALVIVGELGRYKEVHEIVFPKLDKKYIVACVIEGEKVLPLRPEERGTQILFGTTYQFPRTTWGPPLMDWGRRVEKHARKFEMSVQKDGSPEGWSQNCWIGQFGVAEVGKGACLSFRQRKTFKRRSARDQL